MFEGEGAQPLDIAKATCVYANYRSSWWEAVEGSIPQYNKGYAWFLVPFYPHFGYDVRLITTILPVLFSLLVAGFFALYRKAYPRTNFAAFALVAMFSVLCLCLRRYKWHSVTYLTASSIYLYFLPLYYEPAAAFARRCRWIGLSLFLISCGFYFGGLIYVPPFLALIFLFGNREQQRRELIWAGIIVAAGLVLFALTYASEDLWRLRISEVLKLAAQLFHRDGLSYRLGTLRTYFFTVLLSPAFLLLFVVGLGVSIKRIRRGDRFAQINTVLFAAIWSFEILIEGVENPDQLNWSMIPILGLLLTGASSTIDWLRGRFRYGMPVALVLVAAAGWYEVYRYPDMNREADQPYVQDRNVRTEAALVLRVIKEDESKSVRYFLPAPGVAESDGGFDYSVSLLRVDYAPALAKVAFFGDEDDLRQKLRALPKGVTAVVYLSVGYPADGEKDTIDVGLLGHPPVIFHPYEDIYRIPFNVREFRFTRDTVPPISLKGMTVWLESTEGTEGIGKLNAWADQSGQRNDATSARASSPPTIVPDQVNGLPVVHFSGANALKLPIDLLKDAHSARVIGVVRIGRYPDRLNVLWNFGLGWGSTYKDTLHFEDFGNEDTNAVQIETPEEIFQFFVYDTAVDEEGNLTFRRNGVTRWTKHVPKLEFQPIPDIGGYGDGSFVGDIAEMLLFTRPLTQVEEEAVYKYLGEKYGIKDLGKNLAHGNQPAVDAPVSGRTGNP